MGLACAFDDYMPAYRWRARGWFPSRARTRARSHDCERCTQECVRHGTPRVSPLFERANGLPDFRLAGDLGRDLPCSGASGAELLADVSVERNRDSAAGAEKEQSQIQTGSGKLLNAAARYVQISVEGWR